MEAGSGSVTRWTRQLASSDPEERNKAARQIWLRYFERLQAIAKQNLSSRVRQREDEEDVVQVAYRSFCRRLGEDGFVINNRAQLWRVLVTITLNKARKTAGMHTAECRDVRAELQASMTEEEESEFLNRLEGTTLSASHLAELEDQIERLYDALSPELQQVAQWKLEGHTNREIADSDKLDCSVRTVERKLDLIRRAWSLSQSGFVR